MTLVLPDGTIARSGGRVVKNVAGYDLCKLLTGSLGTLAVITEATFRLHPLPQHPQTFTVSAPQAAQLAPLMATIRASHLLTESLQLRGDTTGFHLDIQLNAHPEAHQDDILKKLTESAGLQLDQPLAPASQIAPKRDDGGSSGLQAAESNPPTNLGFSPGPFDNVWAARESLLRQEDTIIIKVTMLPEGVPAFAQEVAEKNGQSITQSLGIMYASFPAGDLLPKLAEEFRYNVRIQGGTTLRLFQPPSSTPAKIWAFMADGELPAILPLMQSIKHQFDPNQILNPGRFLGGI
jgi:glycolate oxidase FAD binding subunit